MFKQNIEIVKHEYVYNLSLTWFLNIHKWKWIEKNNDMVVYHLLFWKDCGIYEVLFFTTFNRQYQFTLCNKFRFDDYNHQYWEPISHSQLCLYHFSVTLAWFCWLLRIKFLVVPQKCVRNLFKIWFRKTFCGTANNRK